MPPLVNSKSSISENVIYHVNYGTDGRTSSIMPIMEQMVETRSWKAARGLIEDGRCRVCRGQDETVEQLVAGCTVLSNSEYLARHNRALMILAVTLAKERKLIGADTVWYK